MQTKPNTLSARRLARFIAWTRCVVLWLSAVFAGRAEPIARRLGLVDVDALSRAVGQLIFLRAVELSRFRPRPRCTWRSLPPPGFRQMRASTVRASIGSRVRQLLKKGAGAARLAALLGVLNDIDAQAKRLARRLGKGFTRLCAIVASSPPAARVSSTQTPAPLFLDTS